MTRPRRIRRRVFVGCEGPSERSYITLLAMIADELSIPIAFDPQVLHPTGGNPATMMEDCLRVLEKRSCGREAFAQKAILIDGDCFGVDLNRDARARKLAQDAGVRFLIQQPDHEGFLLRHLPGCEQLKPPKGQSLQRLQKEWGTYQKNMSARELRSRVGISEIRSACVVEAALREFLLTLGFDV
jgi:hypothetical protein